MSKWTTTILMAISLLTLSLSGCVFKIEKACCCPDDHKNVAVDLQLEATVDHPAADSEQ